MTSSLSRFKIIQGWPPVLPHKCAVCGTSDSNTYLDFGLDLDFYGTVYLCRTCFAEAGNVLEFYSKEQYERTLKHNEELRQQIEVLNNKLEGYRDVARTVDRLSTLKFPEPVIVPTKSDPIENFKPYEPDKPEPDGDTNESDNRIEETKPEPVRQINEQRPTDIQRDDSLDQLLNDI